jgi:hypothetical protein
MHVPFVIDANLAWLDWALRGWLGLCESMSINQSNQPIYRSVHQPLIQSTKQSVSQSVNPAIIQSFRQSTTNKSVNQTACLFCVNSETAIHK